MPLEQLSFLLFIFLFDKLWKHHAKYAEQNANDMAQVEVVVIDITILFGVAVDRRNDIA